MDQPRSFEQWLSIAGSVLAPAGIGTALLFYFGYASTRATYEYFGVDVDTVDLSTTEVVLRSPRPLLVPMVSLAILALVAVWFDLTVRRYLVVADELGERRAEHARRVGRLSRLLIRAGFSLLIAGTALLVAFPLLLDWAGYDMLTPICLLVGVVLATYGRQLRDRVAASEPGAPSLDAREKTLRRVIGGLCVLVVAGSAFWIVSTLALWSGRGEAVTLSERFNELASVILDTKESLFIGDPNVRETVLPASTGDQAFHYRYRGFRLLVEGGNRLFLVPERWSNRGTTVMVPMDDSVRVQFLFQNPG